MKRELVYPFFIECSLLAQDRFWQSIFEDLAYGIAPYGAFVNKDFIVCNYKDKEFIYKIVKKDIHELYNDIYNLFTSKLNVISSKDAVNKRKTVEVYQEIFDDWSNIKKKSVKDILVENWVLNMKTKHNLCEKQAKYLISIIFLALVFKVITSKDIILENGVIKSIEGISFKNGKIIVEKNIYEIQCPTTPNVIITEKLAMSDEWPKYLSTLRRV